MKYDLTTPCGLCPFRNDEKRLHVPVARLREFASGEFCCHKTTESDGEGYAPKPESQHCAGALIFLEKQNAPHQMMRICERIGMYDHTKLDMDAPVLGSFAEAAKTAFKRAKKPELAKP